MAEEKGRRIPDTIGEYRILARIGAGGMAELFAGRTAGRGYGKVVAIKQILPHMASDEGSVQMFFDEARISARLAHSNIAQIFDLGISGGAPFIAMEYVHGVSLNGIMASIKKRGRIASPALAAYVMEKVCTALGHAHGCRDEDGKPLEIVHRDVSPSNVLCSFDGEVKLIDFGIAKAERRLQHTRTGYLKGKLAYMSPEQVRGLPVDHRSDIFAAGTLLYVMLTGLNPFRADTDTATLERVRLALAAPPRSVVPGIPSVMEEICVKAMSLDVEDRFEDARVMASALGAFRDENPFDRRLLAAWMRENFSDEMNRSAALLQQAERGTVTNHAALADPSALDEQDETQIFARYTPPPDLHTATIQTPPPDEMSLEPPPPPAVEEPLRSGAGARGVVVLLALGVLALAATVIYLTSRIPAFYDDQDGRSKMDAPASNVGRDAHVRPKNRPTRPVLRVAPTHADAGGPDLAPTTQPPATPDAMLDNAGTADSAATPVKLRQRKGVRRRGPHRWRRKRKKSRRKVPPTKEPAPATKPGVAPLPYPTL